MGKPTRTSSYGFGAARRDRDHNENWRPINQHPDAEIAPDLYDLRARSRAITRDTAPGREYLEVMGDHVIGDGLVPKPKPAGKNGVLRKKLASQISDLWDLHADDWDLRGMCDVYGLQKLCLRCIMEAGAVIFHMPFNKEYGQIVPISGYGIEPDMLADMSVAPGNQADGKTIRHGIEVNKHGRPVNFWIYPDDGQETIARGNAVPIPASECAYGSRIGRFGQILGYPWTSAAMETIRDVNRYQSAENVRARFNAAVTDYVTSDYADHHLDAWSDEENVQNADGTTKRERVETIELGMRTYLPAGSKITRPDTKPPGSAYKDFVRSNNRGTAVGVGLSYEMLFGDYEQTHFSASRALWLKDVKRFRDIQSWFICSVARQMYERFVLACVMGGLIDVPASFWRDPVARKLLLRVEWRRPGFPWMEPHRDAQAAEAQLAMGINTRERLCSDRGDNWREILAQLKDEEDEISGLGLQLNAGGVGRRSGEKDASDDDDDD